MDRVEKYKDKLSEEHLKKMLETRDGLMNYLFNKKPKALEDNELFRMILLLYTFTT